MNYFCVVIAQYENLTKEELIQEIIEAKTSHDSLQHNFHKLQFELVQLRRMIFGSKRERFVGQETPGQLSLLDVAPKQQQEEQKTKVPAHERTKSDKKKPSRNLLPEHLERIVTTIYPEGFDENSTAPRIGEEVTEVLNYIPGKFYVEQTVRVKFKTAEGKIAIAEPAPRPIAKGLFGTALIVRILVDKYVDHLPLYRQCERFKRVGVTMAESTVGDVPRQVAQLMELLYQELIKQVLQSNYINADETPTPVLDAKKKGKTHRGYHWVYHSPGKKLVLFDYREGRGREGPDEMLKNFTGFLQTDGYSVYEAYENKEAITLVGCMAHARRYFEQALQSDRERAEHVLTMIQKLYAVERTVRESETPMNDQQIVALRQTESKPVLDELRTWLQEHLNVVTPSSPLGKAISYTYARWNKLTVYINHAQLNIDNNLVENAIRPSVIGRKNYLFAGSHEGARNSAVFYSFLGSCKMNNVNPEEWLADVLEKLPGTKSSQLYTLLPNYWQAPQKK
jgi:transposase